MTQLRVIQPDALRPPPLFVSTAAAVQYGGGFYAEEHDDTGAFRWMGPHAALVIEAADEPRFLEYWTFSEFHDESQRLEVRAGDRHLEDAPLVHGWSPRSLEVPAGVDRLDLSVSRPFPPEYYPRDPRVLALRVRELRLHADTERHAAVRRQQENAIANTREILEGHTVLASTPPALGIDMHGACNVKPPCVYCEWDASKALEEDRVDAPFTRDTLREWGPFFDNAISLFNCSIGEPFMMRQIDELLDTYGNTGKVLEMTTNGQILTDRNVQKLVGRPIDLYVSLDAATPATYARLRNDTFEKLLRNVRRLVDAKGGPGRLPRVHVVFMPMRCNLHEVDDVVRLAADLRVDRLVLRPLNYSPAIDLTAERAGYRFDYQHELLPFEELVAVSARMAGLARQVGLALANQLDFGGDVRVDAAGLGPAPTAPDTAPAVEEGPAARPSTIAPPVTTVEVAPQVTTAGADGVPSSAVPSLGGERLPLCTEPWKSLFILRRGVSACCYGGAFAPMEDYREAWNSPEMQQIRAELLAGRFPGYCLRSRACPIVRKSHESGTLPRGQQALLWARGIWALVNRWSGGVPRRVVRRLRQG
jgi:sulfatase maturation enzyme AslB (radical SAM superfamily)